MLVTESEHTPAATGVYPAPCRLGAATGLTGQGALRAQIVRFCARCGGLSAASGFHCRGAWREQDVVGQCSSWPGAGLNWSKAGILVAPLAKIWPWCQLPPTGIATRPGRDEPLVLAVVRTWRRSPASSRVVSR